LLAAIDDGGAAAIDFVATCGGGEGTVGGFVTTVGFVATIDGFVEVGDGDAGKMGFIAKDGGGGVTVGVVTTVGFVAGTDGFVTAACFVATTSGFVETGAGGGVTTGGFVTTVGFAVTTDGFVETGAGGGTTGDFVTTVGFAVTTDGFVETGAGGGGTTGDDVTTGGFVATFGFGPTTDGFVATIGFVTIDGGVARARNAGALETTRFTAVVSVTCATAHPTLSPAATPAATATRRRIVFETCRLRARSRLMGGGQSAAAAHASRISVLRSRKSSPGSGSRLASIPNSESRVSTSTSRCSIRRAVMVRSSLSPPHTQTWRTPPNDAGDPPRSAKNSESSSARRFAMSSRVRGG
jgi:hypothetical protein